MSGGTLFSSEYCPGGQYSRGDIIHSDTGRQLYSFDDVDIEHGLLHYRFLDMHPSNCNSSCPSFPWCYGPYSTQHLAVLRTSYTDIATARARAARNTERKSTVPVRCAAPSRPYTPRRRAY